MPVRYAANAPTRFFDVMRREIDNCQYAAGCKDTRRFGDNRRRVVSIMKHEMQGRDVETGIFRRQLIHIPLTYLTAADVKRIETGPGERQHLAREGCHDH